MARCPHCQASLPEAATFCAACGRRIEGWSAPPKAQASEAGGQPEPLPGGEEPTRAMEPTPSLLKAAALAKSHRAKKGPAASGPVETDSALLRAVRGSRVPIALALLAVAFAAAAGAFFLVRRQAMGPRVARPAPPSPAAPAVATAIAHPSPPAASAPAAVSAPAPAAHPTRRGPAPHRLEALTIPARKHARHAGHDRTGLPMKVVDTDSRSAPAPAPAAAPPPITRAAAAPLPDNLPNEAAPLTDAELEREARAQIDADGVRFVVKAHLPQVHACYQRAFKDSSPGGRVEIGFAIDPAGRALRVRTEVNTTDSALLPRCLEQRVKEWQFPHPVGGDYDLVYPFVFQAGS